MIGFFANLFGKPKQRFIPPDDDWQVNDLAECRERNWIVPGHRSPSYGRVYRVTRVVKGEIETRDRPLGIGLGLEGLGFLWLSNGFRKVRPTIEPASEEFRAFLKDAIRGPVEVSRNTSNPVCNANSSNSLHADSRPEQFLPLPLRSAPLSSFAPVALKPGVKSRSDRFPAVRPAPYSNTGPAPLTGRSPPAAHASPAEVSSGSRESGCIEAAANGEEWRHLPDPVLSVIETIRLEQGWPE